MCQVNREDIVDADELIERVMEQEEDFRRLRNENNYLVCDDFDNQRNVLTQFINEIYM